MIVKCIAKYPSEDEMTYLGPKFFKERDFHVTIGREYIVFALTFLAEPDFAGRGLFVDIVTDFGHLVGVPLCLFSIIEGSASRYWEIREGKAGQITMWPQSFYREYYHDDLSEGVPEIVQDFNRVRALIEAEVIGRHQPG